MKERHNISIDKDVWRGSSEVLLKSGIPVSHFVEMVLRAVWESDNASYKKVTGDLFSGLVDVAEANLKKKRRKVS